MPYPKHNRLVIRGTLGDTDEIWSFSTKWKSEFTGDFDLIPQGWNESDLTAAITTFMTSSLFSTAVKTTGWRGYQIGADGRLIGDNIKVVEFPTPLVGASGTMQPPQTSLVITTVAGSRGYARLGRFFLPIPSTTAGSGTLKISAVGAQNALATVKTFIGQARDAMDNLVQPDAKLINVSPGGAEGRLQDVVFLRCGLVLDTLRSRRNALSEDYEELALDL